MKRNSKIVAARHASISLHHATEFLDLNLHTRKSRHSNGKV